MPRRVLPQATGGQANELAFQFKKLGEVLELAEVMIVQYGCT